MELNELIEKLEEAQGQATEGEWSVENRYLVDRSQPSIRSVGVVETDEQAQAIATRHNMAGAVLEKLQDLRLLIECSRDEILHLRERAEAAEERASKLAPS